MVTAGDARNFGNAPSKPGFSVVSMAVRSTSVTILFVPDCPHVGTLRRRVDQVLAELDLDAVIEEIEGPYPSPTLLVNGVDVLQAATSRRVEPEASCRLDIPTEDQIRTALENAAMR